MAAKLTRAGRVIAFIERICVVPEGALIGQPMKLLPFQKRFIKAVYDNKVGTRRAILSIARKNGKSGLIAGILLAHLVGPEARRNTQIVSGAMSRDQAALVFNLAAKMVQLSERLSKLVKIVPSGKRLVGLPLNVEYRALAADGTTAHGLSPVLAILDEIGQVRGPRSDFVDAITTAQGAHADPLLLAISTQAPNDADLLSIWIDDAKKSGDPRVVCAVYEAPKDAALNDRKAWKAANPALGAFRSLPDVEQQAEMALRMPSSEASFRASRPARHSSVDPFGRRTPRRLSHTPESLCTAALTCPRFRT
jgi:phage terminase large subunit-like protein